MIEGKPVRTEQKQDTRTRYVYEIRVEGNLEGQHWMSWLEGMEIATRSGQTIIRGSLMDQSALYGILSQLRNLAIPLISVKRLEVIDPYHKQTPIWIRVLNVLLALMIVGWLSALTVFFVHELDVAVALAFSFLFGFTSIICYVFYKQTDTRLWAGLSITSGSGAVFTAMLYLAIEKLISTALFLAILLILLSAVLISFLGWWNRKREDSLVYQEPVEHQPIESKSLR